MAFILGAVCGAAAVLAIFGLRVLLTTNAYMEGYIEGLLDRHAEKTEIKAWKRKQEIK